jgi:hypothetical protein
MMRAPQHRTETGADPPKALHVLRALGHCIDPIVVLLAGSSHAKKALELCTYFADKVFVDKVEE